MLALDSIDRTTEEGRALIAAIGMLLNNPRFQGMHPDAVLQQIKIEHAALFSHAQYSALNSNIAKCIAVAEHSNWGAYPDGAKMYESGVMEKYGIVPRPGIGG